MMCRHDYHSFISYVYSIDTYTSHDDSLSYKDTSLVLYMNACDTSRPF